MATAAAVAAHKAQVLKLIAGRLSSNQPGRGSPGNSVCKSSLVTACLAASSIFAAA